jgi:transcription elongation factor Elf1
MDHDEKATVEKCPECESTQVESATTVDLAFGEEIPCLICAACGHTFGYGVHPS